jgi:hypothetical protein
MSGGQYILSGPGVPGYNFVFQASTNSINWINLKTNPAPVMFVDPNASLFPGRVYRAILAQ